MSMKWFHKKDLLMTLNYKDGKFYLEGRIVTEELKEQVKNMDGLKVISILNNLVRGLGY